ncbi:MAG: response regulator [Nannocystaceae bacterium]
MIQSAKHKVLVVDDSATVRTELRRALGGAGFLVIEAVDGVDGYAKFEEHPDVTIALCDINMPRMNGIELLRKLKTAGKFAHIPLVVLTTEADPDLIRQAQQCGVVAWFVKPFNPDLILAAVKKVMNAA